MGFPDRAEHLEDRFGLRENMLRVSLADDAQNLCFESTTEMGSVTASVIRKP